MQQGTLLTSKIFTLDKAVQCQRHDRERRLPL
jgi:hypothetical protein